jgi:hypothetical protein
MQLRQLVIAMAVGTTLACIATFASAQQVYKWKDANGVVHYSQTAPATGTHYTTVKLAGEPDISSTTPATSSAANPQASDSQGGNGPARAKANGGTIPNTAANRKQLCSQLDSNITTLQGKAPVVQQGANGQQMVMSDDQREQQLANARAQKRQYCTVKRSEGT